MERDSNCIFCKIIEGKIPGKTVKDDPEYLAIRDINPQAPVHVLVFTKEHMPNILACKDSALLGRLFQAAGAIARQEKLDKGFRIVVNTGDDGGQTVDHLHIHVLGGRALSWPPG